MADSRHANDLIAIGQLIEDPISADPQRVQAAQPALKRVAGLGIALEQTESVLDRIDQRPAELE